MNSPIEMRDTPPATHPPYPALERLIKGAVPARNSSALLFWSLDGPLTSAISVLSSISNPDIREPYYNPATSAWHPIAHLPLTHHKVSSVTVRVYQLERWDECWCDSHWDHAEPGEEGVEWTTVLTDDGDEKDLLMCCGEARPVDKDASVVITPSVDGEMGFVTVHDYLSVVHPWLMGLRGDLLAAMGELDGDQKPLPEETELMVNVSNAVEELSVQPKEEWLERRRARAY